MNAELYYAANIFVDSCDLGNNWTIKVDFVQYFSLSYLCARCVYPEIRSWHVCIMCECVISVC